MEEQKRSKKNCNTTLRRPLITTIHIKKDSKILKEKLHALQKKLKQQSLLAQKQQQQKKKLKQSIQESIQKYYSVYASSFNEGKLTNDQGLGNCYNFVKQICLQISRDVQVGVLLLTQTDLIKVQEMLPIIVNLIYQSIAQIDVYKKPVIKMIRKLIEKVVNRMQNLLKGSQEISNQIINESFMTNKIQQPFQPIQSENQSEKNSKETKAEQSKQKNMQFLQKMIKTFLNRPQIQQYFNTVASKTITNVLKLNIKKQVLSYHRKAMANSFINQRISTQQNNKRQSIFSQKQDNMSIGSLLSNSFSNEDYDTFTYTQEQYQQKAEGIVDKQTHEAKTKSKAKDEDKTAFTLTQFKMVVFRNYQRQIIQQASFAPTQLKIIVKLLYENFKKIYFHQQQLLKCLWGFLQDAYLQPFRIMAINLQEKLFDIPKKQILSQIEKNLKQYAILNFKFLHSLISRISQINEGKYLRFIVQQQNGFKDIDRLRKGTSNQSKQIEIETDCENDEQTHVMMNSICLNYRQIFLIFSVIKKCENVFKESKKTKILNRLNKLYQMTADLQILRKHDKQKNISPTNTYLLFQQLKFSDLLMMDYLKQYVQQYKGSIIKNILRQVLVQIDEFSHGQGRQNNQNQQKQGSISLSSILYGKMKELQRISTGKCNISLFTKIKYLIHKISESKDSTDQIILVESMLNQATERMHYYVQIYEKSKFHLLRTYSNIKNKNIVVRNTKKTEKNLNSYLKYIQMISKSQISLCVTSPSSRNNLFTSENVAKYHMSAANKFMIGNPQNCVHRENIVLGMPFHISNLSEFLSIFSKFRQVKAAIQTNIDSSGIKTTLYVFMDQLKKKIILQNKLGETEVAQLSKTLTEVVMKILHSYLLQKSLPTKMDISFRKQLSILSFIKAKQLNVPIQNNLQQFWEICSKYFINLPSHKTPQAKVQSLRQVHSIAKVALFHNKNRQRQQEFVETMMIYVLIRAQPKKFISNLNFIQLFLPQSKLLASEGYILSIYKRIVKRIQEEDFESWLRINKNQINERLEQTKDTEQLNGSKYGTIDV